MARLLSRTFLRHIIQPSLPSHPLSLHPRHRSSKSTPAQLFEIDLSSSSSSGPATDGGGGEPPPSQPDAAALLLQLEDKVHHLVLRMSTPDWLPFVPGSSFWVPPERRPPTLPQLIDNWSNRLTHEESLSLATCRGFPSSAFYLPDTSSLSSVKADMELIVVGWETTGLVVNEQEDGEEEEKEQAERNVEIHVSADRDSGES